jgi:hypothetical protein
MTGALEQARTCFCTSTEVCERSTILVVSDNQPRQSLISPVCTHIPIRIISLTMETPSSERP